MVLLEWKYTESYRPRIAVAAKDAIRWKRYGALLEATDGPVRSDVLDFADLLDEPFYQLVRQQLLAHELEKEHAHGADRVRVVHVAPAANAAYQQSLPRSTHRALGESVSEVWAKLRSTRTGSCPWTARCSSDPEIPQVSTTGDTATTWHGIRRRCCACAAETSTTHLYACVDYDGDVRVDDEGVELIVGRQGTVLAYPFSLLELYDLAREVEAEAEDVEEEQ